MEEVNREQKSGHIGIINDLQYQYNGILDEAQKGCECVPKSFCNFIISLVSPDL